MLGMRCRVLPQYFVAAFGNMETLFEKKIIKKKHVSVLSGVSRITYITVCHLTADQHA